MAEESDGSGGARTNPVSTSESDELEEEEDEESLELSEAMPVDSCRSTLSASAARSGRSCFSTLKGQRRGSAGPEAHSSAEPEATHRYHFLDNLGRPRTVLCHTMGKLVVLAKFWVTAIVVSKLSTTCHHPPEDRTFHEDHQGLTRFRSPAQQNL